MIDESCLLNTAAILGLKTKAGREALLIALENVQLLDGKQLDYGPKNISAFGLFGCVVRMNDKVERFKNISGYTTEQKQALRRLREVMKLYDRDWHKLNLLQTLDALDEAMMQFKVLFAKKRKPVLNEKLRDTFRDICNYSIIALLLDTGKWPETED